ncbi:MAG: hypothetical protein AAF564_19935, partial [Bacteroidota bacterium]
PNLLFIGFSGKTDDDTDQHNIMFRYPAYNWKKTMREPYEMRNRFWWRSATYKQGDNSSFGDPTRSQFFAPDGPYSRGLSFPYRDIKPDVQPPRAYWMTKETDTYIVVLAIDFLYESPKNIFTKKINDLRLLLN